MSLLDHIIPQRTAMPDQPDDSIRRRKASYTLVDLPETIAFPQRPSDEPRAPLPVVEATVAAIAFAIVEEEERESPAAYRRADSTLQARPRGCVARRGVPRVKPKIAMSSAACTS